MVRVSSGLFYGKVGRVVRQCKRKRPGPKQERTGHDRRMALISCTRLLISVRQALRAGEVTALKPRSPGHRRRKSTALGSEGSVPMRSRTTVPGLVRGVLTAPGIELSARLPYIGGLDGLRALAVIAVLLFHAELYWTPVTCPPKTSPVPMLVFRGAGPEEGGKDGQEAVHHRGHHQQAPGG